MAKYYHHLTNYHHRLRHLKRLKRLFALGVVIISVSAVVVILDIFNEKSQQPTPASQITTVVQQSPVVILRSEFFQFQAPVDWVEVNNQSTSQKFVYREIKNTQISNQLDVYVNNFPNDILADYVLPVTVSKDQLGIAATELSDHCRNALPTKPTDHNPKTVTYKEVTFNCRVDGTEFIVVAGKVGGTPDIKLMRPGGKLTSYYLVYRDLRADPNGDDFTTIINSFQTR